ncbi:MAG: IS30 family transposase [Thiomicrorhabdus sp.]|nr:IS30 family transposase [Thiomicrorhabdus sp.]
MSHYYHLRPEERAVMMIESIKGESIRSIGKILNRSASTISREMKRNKLQDTIQYCASRAGEQYGCRRKSSVKPLKLIPNTALYDKVKSWLTNKQWSPIQISATLKREYPKQRDMHVSHETIYSFIYAYPKGELKKRMIKSLRRSKSKRGPRGSATSNYNSVKLTEDQKIENRPAEINDRILEGHWEGDLIAGSKNQSCVGTLVERTTGFLILSKMESKSALNVRLGFESQIKKLPEFLRLSMTYDRGSEMAQHPIMSKNLEMKIYFADPHSPWQRGSNENINGLIRQYLPKGTDLKKHSQEDLDKIAWLLNTRPRKRYDFKTPQELMESILAEHINSVALAT